MSYTLQAIIAPTRVKDRFKVFNLECVELGDTGLSLAPLIDEYIDSNGIPFLPLTDGGRKSLGDKLDRICKDVSRGDKAIYVEAEFFGGDGNQACVLFDNSLRTDWPLVCDSAINHALQWLGVERGNHRDEFEAIGLHLHRSTEDWLKSAS